MPTHEFGIMQESPKSGKRYDCYVPQKFRCISVNDDDIVPLLKNLNEVKLYWHTLDKPAYGLAYYGITLIPPESMDAIMEIVRSSHNLSELFDLLSSAQKENKFIIHFGI